MAIAALDVLTFPDDVHAFKTAVIGEDVAGFFEPRFAFADGNAAELEIAGLVKRPLAGKILVFYNVHKLIELNKNYYISQKSPKIIQK